MTPFAVTDSPASFDAEAFLRRERDRVNAALAALASAHAREMAVERTGRAVDALRDADIQSPELEALAAYVLERGR